MYGGMLLAKNASPSMFRLERVLVDHCRWYGHRWRSSLKLPAGGKYQARCSLAVYHST